MKRISLLALILSLTVVTYVHAETMSIQAYVPNPWGEFLQLHLVPTNEPSGGCEEGQIYFDETSGAIRMCNSGGGWDNAPGVWMQSGTDVYMTENPATSMKVGLGTRTPSGELDIKSTKSGHVNLNLIASDGNDAQIRFKDDGSGTSSQYWQVSGSIDDGFEIGWNPGTYAPVFALDTAGNMAVEGSITLRDASDNPGVLQVSCASGKCYAAYAP